MTIRLAALALALAATTSASEPYLEAEMKQAYTYTCGFTGSKAVQLPCEQDRGFQGTVLGRYHVTRDLALVLRADTAIQPQRFDLGALEPWQSAEVMLGTTWTPWTYRGFTVGPGVVGGLIFQLDGTELAYRPGLILGGVVVRHAESRAFLYVGYGRHEATNGPVGVWLSTLRAPLPVKRLWLDVDVIHGPIQRLVVSLSVSVLKKGGS